MKESPQKIIVAGAGLVGSLLAIALKKRGHDVVIYERRSDMRQENNQIVGRSINLIITAKGIEPLLRLDLWETVKKITSPVSGRMMHSKSGELTFQLYGKDESECNYSVSRSDLNKLLMSEAEKVGVKIQFNHSLIKIDPDKKIATFENKSEVKYDLFFGADGAGSITRGQLIELLKDEASYKVEPLGTDYKEILMPKAADGSYPMDKRALHIWPRGNHMLMGLPNLDGSFTMTLYMPTSWYSDFDTKEKIENYFKENYADSLPLMPNFLEEYKTNPQGFLGIVRMKPWVYKDQIAILGDAAHAIVPFFGQGMNSGFSDVEFLLKEFDKNADDFFTSFKNYNTFQKLNGDAIADLSLDNFKEMCERVGDPKFLLRKKVENKLENIFPKKYRARYGMVTYTLIPYYLALEAGKIQDQILDELCRDLTDSEKLNLSLAESLIDQKLLPWIKSREISLERFKIP